MGIDNVNLMHYTVNVTYEEVYTVDSKQLKEVKEEAIDFVEDVVRKIPESKQQRLEDCMKIANAFSAIENNKKKQINKDC